MSDLLLAEERLKRVYEVAKRFVDEKFGDLSKTERRISILAVMKMLVELWKRGG